MTGTIGVTFQVEIPMIPVEGKAVFEGWIIKNGVLQSTESVNDTKYVYKFDANKFVRQDNIQRSLRNAFTKRGLQGGTIRLSTIPFHSSAVAASDAEVRVAQLEISNKLILNELQELRIRVGETSQPIINNNTINNNLILNFGNEDMSHLRPPLEYLESAFAGLRELLTDVYFNDTTPQNNTVRINMSTNIVEVSAGTAWKEITLTGAASKMIEKCGFYMLSAFDSDRHKENDDVVEFGCSMHNPGEGKTASMKKEIHHKLLTRARS